ncbi:MAG: hypothetical protein ACOCQ6_02500 [Bacteroidota bacterium]
MSNNNKVINGEEFNERVKMLSTDVMKEVIAIFMDGYPERKKNIKDALKENSAEKLEFEIHALKNDLSQFAATNLFADTETLLTKVREFQTTNVTKEIDSIEKTIESQLIPELKHWKEQKA